MGQLNALCFSLAEQFAELFDNAELAAVLAEFSPPCTLAEFTNASLHSVEEQVMMFALASFHEICSLMTNYLITIHRCLFDPFLF